VASRSSWAEIGAVALGAGALVAAGHQALRSEADRPHRPAASERAAAPHPAAGGGLHPVVALSRPGGVSRFAFVDRPVTVRSAPGPHGRALGRLTTRTQDGTSELVLLLAGTTGTDGHPWRRVRAPLLPTGTTGWVPAAALSASRRVRTWLVIDRAKLRLTLYRGGRALVRAPVGIGKPSTPTPPGRFYVRDRLTNLNPRGLYGPEAFGTSARSEHVTDWPGGSVVGIHGTNRPGLVPGRPSHGCVRLHNRDIRRLARLLPVGTPLTIR
jgi:hypothetical protein